MKTIYRSAGFIFLTLALIIFSAKTIHALPNGISGATHKSGDAGCYCHGSNFFNTDVSVVIEGPDTLLINETATYTVTVSGGPFTEAGVDIAASNDNLVPVSTYLHVLNNELTHTSPVNYVGGQVVFEFTYTAPDTALAQMLYATGSSRKHWNWAVDKPIVVLGDVPVELISFNASLVNSSIILNWQTSTETNNKGFVIERKLSDEWENISFIQGNGTTTEINHYDFTDNSVPQSFSGKISYRLNQIDFNGTNHYSNIIELDYSSVSSFALLQNYPNPFNPSTVIDYSIPDNNGKSVPVSLKVYDVLGNELMTLVNTNQQAGNYKVRFNGSRLSSGVYIYQLKYGNLAQTKKMVLNK